MKTSYLLLFSALLLGCLSACNTSPRESKVMEANDGSVTTIESNGNKLLLKPNAAKSAAGRTHTKKKAAEKHIPAAAEKPQPGAVC